MHALTIPRTRKPDVDILVRPQSQIVGHYLEGRHDRFCQTVNSVANGSKKSKRTVRRAVQRVVFWEQSRLESAMNWDRRRVRKRPR